MKRKDIHTQRCSDVIEVEAKTAPEAIKIALARLDARRQDVDVEILTEENRGLFSMSGSKLAKVRVKRKLRK